jgi:hypothetical protein
MDHAQQGYIISLFFIFGSPAISALGWLFGQIPNPGRVTEYATLNGTHAIWGSVIGVASLIVTEWFRERRTRLAHENSQELQDLKVANADKEYRLSASEADRAYLHKLLLESQRQLAVSATSLDTLTAAVRKIADEKKVEVVLPGLMNGGSGEMTQRPNPQYPGPR